MSHSKSMFLVDNHEPQILELHISGKKAMRSHNDIDATFFEAVERRFDLFRGSQARNRFNTSACALETFLEVFKMLECQNGGRN